MFCYRNKLDIRELGIQFGCIRLIPLVQKALSLYVPTFKFPKIDIAYVFLVRFVTIVAIGV